MKAKFGALSGSDSGNMFATVVSQTVPRIVVNFFFGRTQKLITIVGTVKGQQFGDMEGSQRIFGMNAWLPHASHPCGNFSDISNCILFNLQRKIGHAFAVCIRTENHQEETVSFCGPCEISVLIQLTNRTTAVP